MADNCADTRASTLVVKTRYVSYEILNKAGTVFKAIDSLSGKCIVMKKLKTLCNHDTCVQEEELWNKVGMDSTTKSKHFARPSKVIVDEDRHYMSFPVYDGNLEDAAVLLPGPFPVRHITEILIQLSLALDFLHSNRVAHRDISPKSILMKSLRIVTVSAMSQSNFMTNKMFASVEIRVSNFGSAAKIPCTTACEYTPAGSTGYRAPELCAGFEHTGAVDIFSSGVVLLELAFGYRLFDTSDSLTDVFSTMEDVLGPFEIDFAESIDEGHPGILTAIETSRDVRCGTLNDAGRGYREIWSRMLCPDPQHRASARSILRGPLCRLYFTIGPRGFNLTA